METIGWAALQVVPTVRGISGQMSSALVGPAREAGTAAGRAAGEGMASGLEAAQAAVGKASDKVAAARNKEADAAGKVRVAEAKLQELRDKGTASASQIAAAEERLATAQRNSDRAAAGRVQAVNDLTQARARAANAADEGEESTRRWGGSLDGFGEKLKGGADELGKFAIAAAGIGGAVALGMQALDNMDVENKLAAQLGATGELAAEYGDMAGSLYKQGLVGTMDEAAEAVSVVATSFATAGFEGEKSIDQISASALSFSQIFDRDVGESVQTASQLVTNGLAKDSTEAFDLMTASFQRVPAAMRDELPEILNEYGTHFRALGFDGQESFNILALAADKGKFALDKTGDALKEFTIRGSDMSQASADAYKSVGLNAEEMSRQIAAGGDGAQQALQQTATALLGINDPATRANTAIALFGTPLEDLSIDQIPEFLSTLTGAEDRMSGFAGSAQQAADTLNSGPNHAMTELKNTIQGGLTDALGSVAQWMMDNQGATQAMGIAVGVLAAGFVAAKVGIAGYAIAQGVAAAATGAGAASLAGNTLALTGYAIATGVAKVATATATAAQWLFNAALSANPIGLIIAAVAALVAGLVWFFTQTETGQKIVSAAWEAIKTGWDFMWNAVSVGIDAFVDALGWIGDKATEVKDWVVGKWNDLVGFVTGLPDRIASAAGGMWDGIKSAFKGAVNWIIQAWNALEFRIPGFEVGPIKWDGFTLGLPDIPMLATGGQVRGPGTGTSDDVLMWGSNGEHMWTAREVSAAGGHGAVENLRAAALAGDLPRYAEGGAVVSPDQLADFAKGVEGKPYVWGGVNWGDCSGAVSAVANFATGRDPFGSRFATGNEGDELAARGFQPGRGPAGSLQVGWFNGGPYGGHTALTLPNGTNFEMGGGRGNGQYGGPAAGASDPQFTDHAHLPMVVAQAVQPNVEQLAPLTGFPTDSPSTAGATSSPSVSTPSSTSGGGASTSSSTQSFSARERFKQMGSDIGGIWADAAVEIFGLGDMFTLADRYTIKADTSSGGAAAPAAPAGPIDPRNGTEGDPNVHPLIKQAQDFLKSVGLFDTGGVWEPGTFGFNGLKEPEHVLKDAHWRTAEGNMRVVDELVSAGAGARGGPRVVVNNYNNQTLADQAAWQRDQAERQSIALMRYGG